LLQAVAVEPVDQINLHMLHMLLMVATVVVRPVETV
jgi:hypothetical protein